MSFHRVARHGRGGTRTRHPDERLVAGRQLGPYEIVALIGEGGMGEVYRAVDSRLGRTVAIKTLPALGKRRRTPPPFPERGSDRIVPQPPPCGPHL